VNERVLTGGDNFDQENSANAIAAFSSFGFYGHRRYNILTESSEGNGPAIPNTTFISGKKGGFQHQDHFHVEHFNGAHIKPYLNLNLLPTLKPSLIK
jgi:hypothetical protein